MTTELDTEALEVAKDLRDEFGKTVSFAVFTYTEDASAGSVAETPIVGSPFSIKVPPPTPFALRLVDGDTIRRDDLRVFLVNDALGFTPQLGETGGFRVTVDSVAYDPIAIEPKYSGDDVVGYWLHLRR